MKKSTKIILTVVGFNVGLIVNLLASTLIRQESTLKTSLLLLGFCTYVFCAINFIVLVSKKG